MTTPRGIRNKNPGNIRYDGTKWRGLVGDDGTFCVFDNPINGIRAIAKIIKTYKARGIETISEIVSTWAPPIENNTPAYIQSVCDAMDKNPTYRPADQDYPDLIAAIIYHENGQQPYSRDQLNAGVTAAL